MAYVVTDRSGVPFTESPPAVIGPSGSYTSGGPSMSYGSGKGSGSAFASDLVGALQTSDGDYQQAVRKLLDYSESNSAFNAAEAAKARSWNAEQNQIAMAVSAEEAQKNRDWQEMMSNTSHQRAVSDLIAAGLNPVLAAANGASTPSGSAGSGFASGGSSASADTSGSALGNILASLINTSAQAALQEKIYSYESDLQSKQLATELAKSENQLIGTRLSSQATMAAAGASAAAQRYYADTLRDNQSAQHLHDQLMENLSFEHQSALTATKEKGSNERSLFGTFNDFLKGLGKTDTPAKDSGSWWKDLFNAFRNDYEKSSFSKSGSGSGSGRWF